MIMSIQAIGFNSHTVEFEQEPLIPLQDEKKQNKIGVVNFLTTTLTIGVTTIFTVILTSIQDRLTSDFWLYIGGHALPISVFVFLNTSRMLKNLFESKCHVHEDKTQQEIISSSTQKFYACILQCTTVFFLLLLMHAWQVPSCT